MVTYSGPDLAQPVLSDFKPKPLLKHLTGLLEDNDFQSITDTLQGGRRAGNGQRTFADEENFSSGKIVGWTDGLKLHSQSSQELCRFPWRIEKKGLGGSFRQGGASHHLKRKRIHLFLKI